MIPAVGMLVSTNALKISSVTELAIALQTLDRKFTLEDILVQPSSGN